MPATHYGDLGQNVLASYGGAGGSTTQVGSQQLVDGVGLGQRPEHTHLEGLKGGGCHQVVVDVL